MQHVDLTIQTADPFTILSSTKYVMDNACFITINHTAATKNISQIDTFLQSHNEFPDHGHRLTGNFTTDIQLIFFETMMGFCFWAFPKKPKWGIQLADGEQVDGWYGVCAAFKRALDEGLPVTDATYLTTISQKDVQRIFRSVTNTDIPLLTERVSILQENAQILQKHFGGQAENLLEAANTDAIQLCKLILKHFPSFRDTTIYNGKEVVFLKLLHLLCLDIEYRLTPQKKRPFLKNFDTLCVFADYKLPQLLRLFGILEYDNHLSNMIDSYTEIPKGSKEEIEMRAGAIWGIELLRQKLPHYSSIQIGHVIWLMSQDQSLQKRIKPYHRTYTTYY